MESGDPAPFSSVGPCVDIWAPGRTIKAAGIASAHYYKSKTGTSQAAPHVAGLAALYLQSGLTAEETVKAILNDARVIPELAVKGAAPLAAYSGAIKGAQPSVHHDIFSSETRSQIFNMNGNNAASSAPSDVPFPSPSLRATAAPSKGPSSFPSIAPSFSPSLRPSSAPASRIAPEGKGSSHSEQLFHALRSIRPP